MDKGLTYPRHVLRQLDVHVHPNTTSLHLPLYVSGKPQLASDCKVQTKSLSQ